LKESETRIFQILQPNIEDYYFAKVPPSAESLLPDRPKEDVEDTRNHLIALHYMLHHLFPLGLKNLSHKEISQLHQMLLRGLPGEHVDIWQQTQIAGSYRSVPVKPHGYWDVVYPVSLPFRSSH